MDSYFSPSWTVRRLLEKFTPCEGKLLDPCAGTGNIIRSSEGTQPELTLDRWYARELDYKMGDTLMELLTPDRVWMGSFTGSPGKIVQHPGWPERFGCVFTNPPYSLFESFLKRSLEIARQVVYLLPLNRLGSERRASMMRDLPPDIYVLPNRPSFTSDGHTDSLDYAWYVWDQDLRGRDHGELRHLASTSKAERALVTLKKWAKSRKMHGFLLRNLLAWLEERKLAFLVQLGSEDHWYEAGQDDPIFRQRAMEQPGVPGRVVRVDEGEEYGDEGGLLELGEMTPEQREHEIQRLVALQRAENSAR